MSLNSIDWQKKSDLPVVNGSVLGDVHPGEARGRRGLGLLRRCRIGDDERVEDVAGDAGADGAAQPLFGIAFSVDAEHQLTAQQQPHLVRLQHRSHFNQIYLEKKKKKLMFHVII